MATEKSSGFILLKDSKVKQMLLQGHTTAHCLFITIVLRKELCENNWYRNNVITIFYLSWEIMFFLNNPVLLL